MEIPNYQSIMLPLLKIASDGKEHKASDAYLEIAKSLQLSPEELKQLTPAGQDYLFSNRCGWSKTYLKKAGLIMYPTRGVFQITEAGIQLLAEKPEQINIGTLKRFPVFLEYWNGGVNSEKSEVTTGTTAPEETEPPEIRLESASLQIRKMIQTDILAKLINISPAAFERAVLRLIQKMGYGETGNTIGGSHDGGVDAVIYQDRLGFERIYLQAKRWKDTSVGSSVVRDFVGALAGKKARHGVILTTSQFSSDAKTNAETLHGYSVILVDGEKLADLMIEFGLGTAIANTYYALKIDGDFFDELEDS